MVMIVVRSLGLGFKVLLRLSESIMPESQSENLMFHQRSCAKQRVPWSTGGELTVVLFCVLP